MLRFFGFLLLLLGLFGFVNAQRQCSNRYAFAPKSANFDSVDVLHYSIQLEIKYLSQHFIQGSTQIKLVSTYNQVHNITLMLSSLDVDSVKTAQGSVLAWTYNDTLLIVEPSSALSLNDTFTIEVFYQGNPIIDPSGWGGFYFSSDTTFAFNMGVGMTDDPHNYGRVWFPCVDNFTDKATYDFVVVVKNGNRAVCNGTLTSSQVGPNESVYQWSLNSQIPTYLASVAVGPYLLLEDSFLSVSGNYIPIQIYVAASQGAAASASFVHLKQILTAFESYLGPYRWERVGYVGVPFSGGAMEHATSIHIGNSYLNGTLDYETLIAHELSHHWFGNLVTCSTAEDMWLNEGWAVFCESLYQEHLYGRTAYDMNMRTNLNQVIFNTHVQDGAYYSVAGVPHSITYGSTVYDKGATVVHSLRGYLGDDIFFPMIKSYMQSKAYGNQSSLEFRDFISQFSGINMNDFFDAWVFSPGFIDFTVDSFAVVGQVGNQYLVRVDMRQSLLHKTNYANSNRLPLRFWNTNGSFVDSVIEFSGAKGFQSYYFNFVPSQVTLDPAQTYAGAFIQYSEYMHVNDNKTFDLAYYKHKINQAIDSTYFQIIHHFTAPTTEGITYAGLKISTKRYWTVNYVGQANNVEGYFRYWRTGQWDSDIITSSSDSIVLLYRPKGGVSWQKVDFEKQGNWVVGWLKVNHLLSGEYCLGVYDADYLGTTNSRSKQSVSFHVFPNPSDTDFAFFTNYQQPAIVEIRDINGRWVDRIKINNGQAKWKPTDLKTGTYLVVLYDENEQIIANTKIIYEGKK